MSEASSTSLFIKLLTLCVGGRDGSDGTVIWDCDSSREMIRDLAFGSIAIRLCEIWVRVSRSKSERSD